MGAGRDQDSRPSYCHSEHLVTGAISPARNDAVLTTYSLYCFSVAALGIITSRHAILCLINSGDTRNSSLPKNTGVELENSSVPFLVWVRIPSTLAFIRRLTEQ